MARRAQRKSAARGGAASALPERERIIQTFMALLAEQPFERIGLADVASGAGVALAQLRAAFASTFAILAARVKEIDRIVLAGGEGDLEGESPRERLFDVLMRRLEALQADKEAVRSL